MFSFTISENALTISPGSSGSVVVTQVSADPQTVFYGVSSQFAGGYDRMPLDQFGNVTYATSPQPASLTGNSSMTVTFNVSSSAQAGTLSVQIYGLQFPLGDPNSAVNQAQTVTLTVS
jgi:hypothetical protein